MNELPEGLRGRILALALLVIVIAALWIGAVSPLTGWYAARADRLEQQARLGQRMAQVVAELPTLRRLASTEQAAAPVAVLNGGSDAVAAAALQQQLQQIAGKAGAQLASMEVLPGEQLGAYRRIGVRLSVVATWPVLVHLLDAITAGSPRLLVDDLQVQGVRAIVTDPEPSMSTNMVVFGFRLGRTS